MSGVPKGIALVCIALSWHKLALASIPLVQEALNARTDVWGEIAMKQPNGPCYEFFAKLLPPLRYVNAPFRHYPIVLSAPNSRVKARLVSNGSAVNELAHTYIWRSEVGNPVIFLVGKDEEVFGSNLNKLDGPKYQGGYLPIVYNTYRHKGDVIHQEAFAGVEAPYSNYGTVFVSFKGSGKLVALLKMSTEKAMYPKNGVLRSAEGNAVLWFGDGWSWEPGAQRLFTKLSPVKPSVLAIFTKGFEDNLPKLDLALYKHQREKCIETWESILKSGMKVETPEPYVNNAWKSLIIGMFQVVHGDEMRYSAGNQYAKMYVGEGGDAIRALLMWGYEADARRMLAPLMDYKREGLLFHQAAKKLQMLSHYYWLTRDSSWFSENQDRWLLQMERLMNGREPQSGLLPREQYCGDIATPVYSLNSNVNGYDALHQFSAVLQQIGYDKLAEKVAKSATEWRPHIVTAMEKSIYHTTDPPFVPIALFGEEKPYDPLTATRMGSYWDLMAPYLLGTEIFRHDSKETEWIKGYLERKGGLMMGLVRTRPASSFWVVNQNVNPLYTLRYVNTLLQRDEVDRALVSFYGMLAQGFTRDTFIGGEGSCPMPADELGRQVSLPPNTASNAFFLTMLRNILIQDWDMDYDGKPETLRLMFATPRRWLEDGKVITVENAPTAFGEVSVKMTSHLNDGYVLAEVSAPVRTAKQMLLRCRLPEGWRVISAHCEGRSLPTDRKGTVDLTKMSGKFRIRFEVQRTAR